MNRAINATAFRRWRKRKLFFTVKCETEPKMDVKINIINVLRVSFHDRDKTETDRDTWSKICNTRSHRRSDFCGART